MVGPAQTHSLTLLCRMQNARARLSSAGPARRPLRGLGQLHRVWGPRSRVRVAACSHCHLQSLIVRQGLSVGGKFVGQLAEGGRELVAVEEEEAVLERQDRWYRRRAAGRR